MATKLRLFPKMKKKLIIHFFCIFLLGLVVIDCSTYWSHRKKDLGDVFTAGIESPGYGIGVRIGPLATGFVFQGGESEPGKRDLGKGYGLRGGTYGPYRSQQLIFGFLGSEKFHSLPPETSPQKEETKKPEPKSQTAENILLLPENPESEQDPNPTPELSDERLNSKSYEIRYLRFYNNPVSERRKAKKEAFFRRYLESLDPHKRNEAIQTFLTQNPKNKDDYPSAFLYEVEIYISIRYGIRLGFNFGEFLDFLLGFAGIDLMEDDI
ncbi:LIC13411 family adhesin [Leptospira koniambonensis]|uniref:LIC13411 family adhesin n=1 Tax=Leptospira koniambonensis TaxID=2484950 RepID=UPI003EBC9F17